MPRGRFEHVNPSRGNLACPACAAEYELKTKAEVRASEAPALLRAELPRTRFHDLRHAAATFLLAQGMTLEDVKHSSVTAPSR